MTKRQEIEILKSKFLCLQKELTDLAEVAEKTTKVLKNHDKTIRELKEIILKEKNK